MFWDNVAWVYDIFANVINRKANRALCEAVGKLIIPTYMNQMDRGTANSVSGDIGKAGGGFKRWSSRWRHTNAFLPMRDTRTQATSCAREGSPARWRCSEKHGERKKAEGKTRP